ncbi:MAG TPA: sialidase family protein [Thermoanaerobaculia bacterium]|nr:sialidase family protein [Thermoanaerobaculia bacterium]
MREENHFVRALGFALLIALLIPMALIAEGERIKPELKKEVERIYFRLKTDPQLQTLQARLKGNMLNRAVVDPYLSYLPISPLEIFNLDRWTHRWLISVPDYIETYHERWKKLHPAEARRFYGAQRDRRRGQGGDFEEKLLSEGTLKKTEVDANLNLAHDNIQPPTGFQSEVQIVVNPNNPNQLVAGSNTAKFPWSCGPRTIQALYYSSDGGKTWGFTCAPAPLAYGLDCAALGGVILGSDPALAWGANNEVYFNYMAICGVGGAPRSAIVIAKSTDGGATWTPRAIIKDSWATGEFEDKPFVAIDNHPASPYSGRLYSCWVRDGNQKVAFSSDGGANWTERDVPSPPGTDTDMICEMAVQKNGTVHMMLEAEHCADPSTCFDDWIFYTRSTDGGNTWTTPTLVADLNFTAFATERASCPDAVGDRCLISMGSIDVDNSGGECNGTLYVTYSDRPATGTVNNMDIFVKRSIDGGNTWSPAVRVNDDTLGGNVQFFPFLTVDQVKGQPVVAWMDARNDPNNLAVDVFTTRSTNCGLSFKKNVQVTQPSDEFNNSTISSTNESAANPVHNINQYGDYIGLDTRNGKAYVAWTDSRHFFPSFQTEPQKENIGFAVVTFGPPATEDLQASASSTRNTLTWKDNPKATDIVAYNVYRVSGGVYTKIGTVNVSGYSLTSTRSYSDPVTSLTAAKSRSYAVASVDSLGDEGPYSKVVASK